jgi:CRP-like cAMP-binding protein
MANAPVDPSLIGRIPAFAGLHSAEKRAIAAIAAEEKVSAGTVLFRESDPSDDLYFVLAGRVSLGMRAAGPGETIVLSLGPGELCGWSALLGGRRVATVRITEGGALLRLPGRALRDLCDADPRIGYAVMRQLFAALAQRLHDTRIQMLDVFGGKEAR